MRRHAGRLAAAGRQEPAVEGRPAGGSRRCRVPEAALQGRDRVTLDIDASVVHAKEEEDREEPRILRALHRSPAGRRARRAGTFRHRLYAMGGQVVRHARQRVLKAVPSSLGRLGEALWRMRTCRLF